MGAKYLPTVKDQKANLRFQRQQADKLKARKAGGEPGKPRLSDQPAERRGAVNG